MQFGFLPPLEQQWSVGTRQVNVLLNADYGRGRVNDAYFDNLSLVITPVQRTINGALVYCWFISSRWLESTT